jgi:hypothetical protein
MPPLQPQNPRPRTPERGSPPPNPPPSTPEPAPSTPEPAPSTPEPAPSTPEPAPSTANAESGSQRPNPVPKNLSDAPNNKIVAIESTTYRQYTRQPQIHPLPSSKMADFNPPPKGRQMQPNHPATPIQSGADPLVCAGSPDPAPQSLQPTRNPSIPEQSEAVHPPLNPKNRGPEQRAGVHPADAANPSSNREQRERVPPPINPPAPKPKPANRSPQATP